MNDRRAIAQMQRWIVAFGGRRCIMAFFLMVVIILMRFTNYLSEDKFATLLMEIFLIYVSANIIPKVADSVATKGKKDDSVEGD